MPTFGDITVGTDTFPVSFNRALVTRFVLSEAADVTSITMSFDATSTSATSWKGLILADAAGEPGAVLAVGAATACPTGAGLSTGAITVSLAAGTYWLGYVASDSTSRHTQDNGIGVTRMMNGTFSYATPPASWTTAGDVDYGNQLNVYATYDVAGAGGLTATLVGTFGAATLSAAADAPVEAATTQILGALTSSASAAAPIQSATDAILGAAGLSAAAAAAISVGLAASLAPATVSASIGEPEARTASLGATLGAATTAAAASVAVEAAAPVVLAPATAAGGITLPVVAAADVALGTLTLTSFAGEIPERLAALEATLGGLTLRGRTAPLASPVVVGGYAAPIVVVQPAPTQVSVVSSPNTVAVTSDQTVVEVESDTTVVEITAGGLQGEPGAQGPPGPAGGTALVREAEGALGGYRVVRSLDATRVEYADSSNAAHGDDTLGITLNAANDGDAITVLTTGSVTFNGWAWTPGTPVYLALSGLLTQTAPDVGFIQNIGHAEDATTVFVDIEPATYL